MRRFAIVVATCELVSGGEEGDVERERGLKRGKKRRTGESGGKEEGEE